MIGWHWLRSDYRMAFGEKVLVETGKTYHCTGELQLCKNGLHASKRIIDALYYAPGPIICRVELVGQIIHATDKAVARGRKVLWMLDATSILHEFACRCADDALALVEKPDPRSVAAIQAKRDWLSGKITDNELFAAWDAAWGVARDAARAAAWDAAWGVARDAARDAAWVAARKKQNNRLTQMVIKAKRREGNEICL